MIKYVHNLGKMCVYWHKKRISIFHLNMFLIVSCSNSFLQIYKFNTYSTSHLIAFELAQLTFFILAIFRQDQFKGNLDLQFFQTEYIFTLNCPQYNLQFRATKKITYPIPFAFCSGITVISH